MYRYSVFWHSVEAIVSLSWVTNSAIAICHSIKIIYVRKKKDECLKEIDNGNSVIEDKGARLKLIGCCLDWLNLFCSSRCLRSTRWDWTVMTCPYSPGTTIVRTIISLFMTDTTQTVLGKAHIYTSARTMIYTVSLYHGV